MEMSEWWPEWLQCTVQGRSCTSERVDEPKARESTLTRSLYELVDGLVETSASPGI